MNDAGVVLLAAGSVFARRYRVVRCIAAGGMAAVYEVFDARTERLRALKVLLPSIVKDPEVRARFRREAKVTGSIESEHIVEIHDSGIDEDTGAPYLVMELLRGDDLAGLVEKRGPLPAEEVVTLLFQAALGLEKLHSAEIVHRDLKPENLFVTRRDDGTPRIKLLDFGIAKVVSQGSGANVTGGLGTPSYMAPEQIHGTVEISTKTDLYSLAHVAFAALVGRAYWAEDATRGPTIYPALFKLAMGPEEDAVTRAERHGVRLPPAFSAWFAKASAAAPDDRFDSAVAQIQALAESLGVQAPSAIPATTRDGSNATLSGAWRIGGIKASPATRRGRIVLGALVITSIAGVALLATRSGTTESAPSVGSTIAPSAVSAVSAAQAPRVDPVASAPSDGAHVAAPPADAADTVAPANPAPPPPVVAAAPTATSRTPAVTRPKTASAAPRPHAAPSSTKPALPRSIF